MKPVPKRDGRRVHMVFWPALGSDTTGPLWACARCGDILKTGAAEKLRGTLYFCLCGCLNEVP